MHLSKLMCDGNVKCTPDSKEVQNKGNLRHIINSLCNNYMLKFSFTYLYFLFCFSIYLFKYTWCTWKFSPKGGSHLWLTLHFYWTALFCITENQLNKHCGQGDGWSLRGYVLTVSSIIAILIFVYFFNPIKMC